MYLQPGIGSHSLHPLGTGMHALVCCCLNPPPQTTACTCCRSTLACCDHEGPGSFMAEKPLMAVCNWVPDYFSTAVDYDGTTTKKIGIFTVKW